MDWLDEYAPSIDAWADQEIAFEAFMAHHSQLEVLHMSDADFDAWQAEYKRLYDALWDAQMAYYKAIRS
jgi:hypothetical protein